MWDQAFWNMIDMYLCTLYNYIKNITAVSHTESYQIAKEGFSKELVHVKHQNKHMCMRVHMYI